MLAAALHLRGQDLSLRDSRTFAACARVRLNRATNWFWLTGYWPQSRPPQRA